MQHEFMCKSIKDNYSESNIQLKIVEKNGKTKLKYYSSTTSLEGKSEEFNKEITVDYVLDAKINYE